MKIHGQTFGIPVVHATFKRPDNKFINFELRGLLNLDEFDKLVLAPSPPVIQRPGKPPMVDAADPGFKAASAEWGQDRHNYIMMKTLASSPGVEWEKVKEDDPSTWHFWKEELVSLGLTYFELEQLQVKILEANGAAGAMEEARDAFLASMAAEARKAAVAGS